MKIQTNGRISPLWIVLVYFCSSLPLYSQLTVKTFNKSSVDLNLQKELSESAFKLKALESNKDIIGQEHRRYQIIFNEIPLKGMHLTHHELKNVDRVITPANLPQTRSLKNQHSKIAIDQIRLMARAHVPAQVYDDHFGNRLDNSADIRLVYVPKNYNWDEKEWVLAYEVDVSSQVPLQAKRVTLNATNGALIFIENKLCSFHGPEKTSCIEGTAVTKYHGTQSIQTSIFNNKYILLDETRGNGIQTVNLDDPENSHGSISFFFDDDNYWDNANENQDEVAGDVHWGSGETWDFLGEKFGRNGINGNGYGFTSRVHRNVANAFWNAFNGYAIYGDGLPNSPFDRPWTYIDLIAHEMSHGVTISTSDLSYYGESGGLNEAFSDIMGATVEHHLFPAASDWRLSEQISSSNTPIRNMANPKEKKMPDTYKGIYWSSNLEVHSGSSIANFWYHLLVEGGTGTNDHDYDYNVEGLGWEEAIQIVYHTWTNYLGPKSNYNECVKLSIYAAEDLHGTCSSQVLAVMDAWRAVGLLSPETPLVLSVDKQKICELGDPVTFISNIAVEEILWDFGDGNTSTEISPTHIYSANGNYSFSASGISCQNGPFDLVGDLEIIVDDNSLACDSLPVPIIFPQFNIDECGNKVGFQAHPIYEDDVLWDFGDGASSILESPIHVYSNPGTYLVTCIAENHSGVVTESFEIEIAFDEGKIKGPQQLLINTSRMYEVETQPDAMPTGGIWRLNGNVVAGGLNPSITIAEFGWHELVLKVDFANGCSDGDTIMVEVVDELSSQEDIQQNDLTILPNPAKDYFQIKNEGLLNGYWHIHLINNLGQKITGYHSLFGAGDQFSYQLPELSSGLYYLYFENNTQQSILKKLVILK